MQLILIHGSGGSGRSFQHQTEYFQNSEAVDLPGHPEGEPCTSIDEYADWLHEYVKDRGLSDVVLAGHSLGGGIALALSLIHI